MDELKQMLEDMKGELARLTTVFKQHTHIGSDLTQILPKFSNSSVDTYTNKRITKRVVSITTASSYTIDTDSYDCLSITSLAGAINTIDVSGTPTNFQSLIIRIKDNGGSQNITWSTSFASYGSTLPTATTAGKINTVGFLYDSVAAKWGCVAVQLQP